MVMSAKGQRKKMHVWRHNSARGRARHALDSLRNVERLESLTPEARDTLTRVLGLLEVLNEQLKTRFDPEGLW